MQNESAKHLSESIPTGIAGANRHERRRRNRPRERLRSFGPVTPLTTTEKRLILAHGRDLRHKQAKLKTKNRLTALHLDVLHAVLFLFHNCHTGLCFPSHRRIADEAHCHPSTVKRALDVLEAHGLLSWVNRYGHTAEPSTTPLGLPGRHRRVVRVSNSYNFRKAAPLTKAHRELGTPHQQTIPYDKQEQSTPIACSTELQASLDRWFKGIKTSNRG